MRTHTTSVGTYLLRLILAVFVPFLLFTIGTVWRIQNTQLRQQESALLQQANDAARPVDDLFLRLEDGLSVLAGSTALMHGDLDAFGQEMRSFADRFEASPFALTAADGNTLLRIGTTQPPDLFEDRQIRQAMLLALHSTAPRITNLLDRDDPAQRAVAVSVPAFRPNQASAAYVLTVMLGSARLARLAGLPPAHPDGLVLTVRDRNGVTVARSSHADQHIGDPARPGLREAVTQARSGLLADGAKLDGAAAIRAFSTAPVSGFVVVAALPRAAFSAAMWHDLLLVVLAGLGLLILGVLAAAYLARRLVASLRAVGRGDKPTSSGLREVDQLDARLRAGAMEREVTGATLRDSEGRLRDLVGTLDLAAIMARELKGTIRFWSHGCEQMYGWTPREAVGRSSHELLRTQFPVPLDEIEATLLRDGEWTGDLVHRRRDGTMVIAATHKALKRDPDGQPQLVTESLVDVTALREAQETLRRLNQDLEQRVREEVAAREEAQRRAAHADRIQALGQLAGGIAHDFNNVLQAVAGAAALIARRPYDANGVIRLIQVVGDAAARGASITRRMLVLARRGDLRAEPVEVEPLLDGIREVFVHTLGAGIYIQTDIVPGLPRFMADKPQLETALVNLGTNARDAMPDGGTLRLTAALDIVAPSSEAHKAGLQTGGYVRLSVGDDGTGMPDAVLARVGEPFFTTKGIGKGTGLGLSMVKGFAEQSGGGFTVESAVGFGTTATLWLPAMIDDTRRGKASAAIDQRSPLIGRILLVDDDADVRQTLTEQLEQIGHKVLGASGGTDALSILRAREAVDLMITDLSMPGMNGLTLIKEARGLRPSLQAILLTGYAGDATSLESNGLPQNAYTLMRKPAAAEALSARVSALLKRL